MIDDLARRLGDATEAVESRFDELGVELVRALVGLLVDVRSPDAGPTRVAATAALLLRHVAHRACPGGHLDRAYVPLLELLGALSTMPVPDDPWLDPTPDPANPVEVALAAVETGPGAARRLRDAVYRGTFHVPVLDLGVEDDALAVQFLPVVVDGVPRISVFTSRARFERYVHDVDRVPVIEIEGRDLATLCPPGHGVSVNPGMALGHTFTGTELSTLARGAWDTVARCPGPQPSP